MFNSSNPDLFVKTIKEFDFKPNITINNYSRNMSFLGLAGDLYLDCYSGICKQKIKKICENEICYSSDE